MLANAGEGSLRSVPHRARRLAPTVECTLMELELLHENPEEYDELPRLDCMLESSETGGIANMIYPLDMSDDQKKEMKQLIDNGSLRPGRSKLNVGGGVWDGVQVKVPPGKMKDKVNKGKGKNSTDKRRRLFSHVGEKPSKSTFVPLPLLNSVH